MYWFNDFININLSGNDFSKRSLRRLAKMKNCFNWQNIFVKFVNDALTRYDFKNLPNTISKRVLLQSLLCYGAAAIFEKGGSLLALPCAPSGEGFNIYGDFGKGWVFSRNGQVNDNVTLYLPGSDENAFIDKLMDGRSNGKMNGIFIRENAMCYPFLQTVLQFSDAVSDTYRTIDVMRSNCKRPFVVFTKEELVNTVKQQFEQRDENNEFIVGVYDPSKVTIMPFESHVEGIREMTALLDWYYNKFKELCGFKNSGGNINKKGENLITSEITINEEYTDTSIEESLQYIQEGLDLVNRFWGTDIQVISNRDNIAQGTEVKEDEEIQ